jgi:molybdopterin-guanine dinucleotide biosynthesis protein A
MRVSVAERPTIVQVWWSPHDGQETARSSPSHSTKTNRMGKPQLLQSIWGPDRIDSSVVVHDGGMDEGSPPPVPGPAHRYESDGPRRPGTQPSLAGLVLCGGASRRMGTDKALLELDGERLVDRVAGRLARVADPVLVATGTPGRLGPLPWAEVADDPAGGPQAGPLAGIVAGLRASPSPHVAVVAVDAPYPDPQLLRALADSWAGEAALVPLDAGGRPQPLHAVYAADAAAALAAQLATGEHRVLPAVLAAGGRTWSPPAGWDDAWAINWNTPEDRGRDFGDASCRNPSAHVSKDPEPRE